MLRSGWYNGRDLHVNIALSKGQRNGDHSPWCLCWSWKSGKGGCEGQLAALLTSPRSFIFVTLFLILNTGRGCYPLRPQSLPSSTTVLYQWTLPVNLHHQTSCTEAELTKAGHRIAGATKLSMVVPNIWGSPVRILLHCILLAPRILM